MPQEMPATNDRFNKVARFVNSTRIQNRKYFQLLLKKLAEVQEVEEALFKSIGHI